MISQDFYSRLYVKLCNFKDKYGHEATIIVLPLSEYKNSGNILNKITNRFPYTNVNLHFSARVDENEFEIY